MSESKKLCAVIELFKRATRTPYKRRYGIRLCLTPHTFTHRLKRVLASGTRDGRMVFWQFVGTESTVSPEDWEPYAEIDVDPGIHEIQCGPGENLLSASLQGCVRCAILEPVFP